MRIAGDKNGYILRLSARDTTNWANRAGDRWPCSDLSGYPICVSVDENGLCDINYEVDGNELEACVSDFLPKEYYHLWPVWGQTTDISPMED